MVPKKNQDRIGALYPSGIGALECVLCFCLGERLGKVLGPATNAVIGYKRVCKEYREYIKGKRQKVIRHQPLLLHLTFSCRRTRSMKNLQQFSLESTSPRPLTSFLTLLMMFSTSSSGKRSGISPRRRGHIWVYRSGCRRSLRAKGSCCLPLQGLREVPSSGKTTAPGAPGPQEQQRGTEGHSAEK